ncbi:ABC transporter permease [Rhodococcus sp. G-MC3]|uniref:ABC transporter permease n=1 Tax=Rhodococcus sp. G-MC3 TaxID=3046209 RepID=UPI0024BBDEB8|nr:ABC transporter permease [Rhodococcus sp. G-MC3]MDJ0396371.1 ABC transporter permease [Rhodococcus sp. G-MC3]
MIWVTWRQFRATILAGVLTPLLLALVIAAFTLALGDRSGGFGLFDCFGVSTTQCLLGSTLTLSKLATIALPVMLGVFVGVSVFSRDIERRTHVLGLTQSVSRQRWYWTRILVVFSPVVLAMLILGLVAYWSQFHSFSGGFTFAGYTDSRLEFPSLSMSGLVPAGYTALGLTIGSTAALVLRNTIGAMIATLVVIVTALILFPVQIRQHYATTQVEELTLEERFSADGYSSSNYSSSFNSYNPRWTVGSDFVDTEGRTIVVDYDFCTSLPNEWPEPNDTETTAAYNDRVSTANREAMQARVECLRANGIDHFENRYHEDRLFWRFQLTEAALCLLLSIVLTLASVPLVRRIRP